MIQNIGLYAVNAANANKSAAGSVQETGDFASVLESTKNTKNTSGNTGEATALDDIFLKASEAYQVPLNLLKAVAKTESNFNPDAVSSCGAQGVMQLMPSTAAGLGVQDAFNPEQNIMGGAKYLSQMLDRYDGDVKLCLAAYNAGAGNVAKYGGIPPFKETQAYVEKVMNYMGEELETPNIQMEQAKEKNLIFTVRASDRVYTNDDYSRFLSLFREQVLLSRLDDIYQERK